MILTNIDLRTYSNQHEYRLETQLPPNTIKGPTRIGDVGLIILSVLVLIQLCLMGIAVWNKFKIV
jgi:hypothetical protein